MAKGIEKLYYKESPERFQELLNLIRSHPDTVHFFVWTETPYYYHPDRETSAAVLKLHKDVWTFDSLFRQFSVFAQKQIIQSLIIDETISTNAVENIRSTRHDVFAVLQTIRESEDRKLVSIANSYQVLLEGPCVLKTNRDIRTLYDRLMEEAVEGKDLPDGRYYRKDHVYINDGLRNVHNGFYPESSVNRGMEEVLHFYNDKKMDVFERIIFSHFLFETVHPFYDGNGRLGRFLMTNLLYRETGSYSALQISAALNRKKTAYFKAFKEGRGIHQFGSLNAYFLSACEILHQEYTNRINLMRGLLKQIEESDYPNQTFSKSERKILRMLEEAALLSTFGVSNDELIEYSGLSRRTVVSAMIRFRKEGILTETKFGKTTFHKLNESVI